MLGIDIGVQETHRYRVYAFGRESSTCRSDACAIQRQVPLAGAEQALFDLTCKMTRDQRAMTMEEQIVGFRAIAAADDVDVARAPRDDQPGFGAFALDE